MVMWSFIRDQSLNAVVLNHNFHNTVFYNKVNKEFSSIQFSCDDGASASLK